MNKSDLVDAIAESAGLSKADAGRALDAFVDTVTSTLKGGDGVSLVTPYLEEKGVACETRESTIHGGTVAKLGEAIFMSRGFNEIFEGPAYIRKVEVHGGPQSNPNG